VLLKELEMTIGKFNGVTHGWERKPGKLMTDDRLYKPGKSYASVSHAGFETKPQLRYINISFGKKNKGIRRTRIEKQ
jgi:hypothetical protein